MPCWRISFRGRTGDPLNFFETIFSLFGTCQRDSKTRRQKTWRRRDIGSNCLKKSLHMESFWGCFACLCCLIVEKWKWRYSLRITTIFRVCTGRFGNFFGHFFCVVFWASFLSHSCCVLCGKVLQSDPEWSSKWSQLPSLNLPRDNFFVLCRRSGPKGVSKAFQGPRRSKKALQINPESYENRTSSLQIHAAAVPSLVRLGFKGGNQM